MPLDPVLVGLSTRRIVLKGWVRIYDARFIATPLGTGKASSRFSSPKNSYQVLYAASTLQGALAEGLIRDRFEGATAAQRVLHITEITSRAVTAIDSIRELRLLDLTGSGPLRLGIDTEALGNKDHRKGQDLAQEVHDTFPAIDGILYHSRLVKDDCVAIFDRAIPSGLRDTRTAHLVQMPDLINSLHGLAIRIDCTPLVP